MYVLVLLMHSFFCTPLVHPFPISAFEREHCKNANMLNSDELIVNS